MLHLVVLVGLFHVGLVPFIVDLRRIGCGYGFTSWPRDTAVVTFLD